MAGKFCTQCGSELQEGKKFCRKCGRAVVASAAAATPSSPAEQFRPAGVLPTPLRGAPLYGGAAVLLVVLGATAFWLHHRHTIAPATPVAATSASTAPSSTGSAAAARGSNAAPAQAALAAAPAPLQEPGPGGAAFSQPQPALPRSPARPSPANNSAAPPQSVSAQPKVPGAALSSQPDLGSGEAMPVAAAARPQLSGTLHYTGPPVPFGGFVVFSNLSGARLHFVYDRSSWQALIARRPDGTQTLTLRSIKHADQSQCDVQWEVIP